MANATVTCPCCGTTETFFHGLPNGNGRVSRKCGSCRSNISMEIRSGAIFRVHR